MLYQKLLKYLNYPNGYYIECGANDGVFQSNTYKLETDLNWGGILIEPSPSAYKECLKNRCRNNLILNCALVEPELNEKTVCGDFDGHPMSSINGRRRGLFPSTEIKSFSLDVILKRHKITRTIDFFSLDVEGYELNVLRGLTFETYKPTYVLIEIYNIDFIHIINFMLEKSYHLIENVSAFTRVNNPQWDGTHNDYLFKRI